VPLFCYCEVLERLGHHVTGKSRLKLNTAVRVWGVAKLHVHSCGVWQNTVGAVQSGRYESVDCSTGMEYCEDIMHAWA
jgi:hypothetical protein